MIDKELYCKDAYDMINAAHETIYEALGKLKYVNLKYKCHGQAESAWLYNVDFDVQGDQCVITFLNADTEPLRIAVDDLAYLKLRPYYIAACVGFKNIIFYSHEMKGDTHES
ncbi:MAG: hypothetical protein UDB11_06105 [Peptococcaceae bacterium]|nr:hypothetical protein [Peptococcaceae bacterium]